MRYVEAEYFLKQSYSLKCVVMEETVIMNKTSIFTSDYSYFHIEMKP